MLDGLLLEKWLLRWVPWSCLVEEESVGTSVEVRLRDLMLGEVDEDLLKGRSVNQELLDCLILVLENAQVLKEFGESSNLLQRLTVVDLVGGLRDARAGQGIDLLQEDVALLLKLRHLVMHEAAERHALVHMLDLQRVALAVS